MPPSTHQAAWKSWRQSSTVKAVVLTAHFVESFMSSRMGWWLLGRWVLGVVDVNGSVGSASSFRNVVVVVLV
jgi:hypothetical protein